jgi:hypothetical protein
MSCFVIISILIALLDPWKVDVVLTKDLLQEFDLRAHASLGLSPTTDVTSTDAAIIAKGDELLRKATDVLAEIGGKELCGEGDFDVVISSASSTTNGFSCTFWCPVSRPDWCMATVL